MRIAAALMFMIWTTLANATVPGAPDYQPSTLFPWLDQRTAGPSYTGLSDTARFNVAGISGFAGILTAIAVAGEPGKDKAAHCIAGATFGVVGEMLGKRGDGWRLAIVMGAAKEGLDATGFGTPDAEDFAWTAACGAAPWALIEALRG